MILFIAPNPHKSKNHDGYLQRIAAIDKIFSAERRIYFDDLSSQEEIINALASADAIYVHSIYQAEKILDAYRLFPHKIITDLHGIVPEENRALGNIEQAERLEEVEKIVFQHGKHFVAVSNVMAQYLTDKYHLKSETKWIILPIFDSTKTNIYSKDPTQKSVIYAGGVQRWQNIELMIDIINKTSKEYHYTILTPSPEVFLSLGLKKEKDRPVALKNVPADAIYNYYARNNLGFILRDETAVNKVACPTKLVEYLNNGVVPVVLSPHIGDFEDMGYRYFTVEQLLQNEISSTEVEEAIRHNYSVAQRLRKIASQGTNKLKTLYEKVGHANDELVKILTNEVLKSSYALAEAQNELSKQSKEITKLEAEIVKKERELREIREMLINILASKRWKISSALAKISPHSLRHRRK